MSPDTFRVQGCPVAEGNPACVSMCGGWARAWNTKKLTRDIYLEHVEPSDLSCGVLVDRANDALANERRPHKVKRKTDIVIFKLSRTIKNKVRKLI